MVLEQLQTTIRKEQVGILEKIKFHLVGMNFLLSGAQNRLLFGGYLTTDSSFNELKPRRVLIVDDQPEIFVPLRKILKGLNCQVQTVSKFERKNVEKKISEAEIIILDWNLGHITGDDFLQRYRPSNNQHLVTYSSSPIEKLDFNQGSLSRVNYLGHWRKNLTYKQLETHCHALISGIQN